MREIKFRAKIKAVVSNWVYGSLITYKDGSADICGVDIFRKGDKRSMLTGVKPDTVGQFTGLHDKNGKEIYEGDILSITEYENELMHMEHQSDDFDLFKIDEIRGNMLKSYVSDVCWDEGTFLLSSNAKHDMYLSCLFGDMKRSQPIFEFEVIGNIHDNPELLEGGVK